MNITPSLEKTPLIAPYKYNCKSETIPMEQGIVKF